ncbi:MAG: carboxypeptidase regulatory-like domain-containing protein [Polyangiaceae bacterium]|nr:carboxypeptidase regulatory-like domain-containing protein [Polyangiaceae bacterium]
MGFVVVPVSIRRLAERLVGLVALVICLAFVVSLTDVALVRDAPVARHVPRPPSSPNLQTGELSVVATQQEDGAPISKARVRAFWEHEQRFYEAGEGSTDEKGRVLLRGLPRGKTWVLAEAVGRARRSTQLVVGPSLRTAKLELPREHTLTVTVRAAPREPLGRATVLVYGGDALPVGGLSAADGSTRLGRLSPPPWTVKVSARGFESITRTDVMGPLEVVLRRLGVLAVAVHGPDAKPVSGADVTLGGTSLWPARQVQTGHDGSVEIGGLLDGVYDLRATSGTWVSETAEGIELVRGGRREVTLVLRAGRMVTAWVTDGEADGALPVAGADVVLVEGGLSPFPLRGRTEKHGRVTLGPIGAGAATLAARADGFVARSAVAVPPELTGPVRVALLRGATLAGEVVDERGFPIDAASVEIVGTDLDGFPIAETPLALAFQRAHFEWALGGPLPLLPVGELGVSPGPVPPVPQGQQLVAMVDPSSSGDTWSRPQASAGGWVTDLRGGFSASPVTPGRLQAIARHPAYLQAVSDWVRVMPGETASVRVVMRRGAALEGCLVDDRGWPVAGAPVTLSAMDAAFRSFTITSDDGAFAFASVPDRVVLDVSRPGESDGVVVRRELEVPEAGLTDLKLTLPAPRQAVRVTVLDERDQPIDAAQVLVMSTDAGTPLRRTLFTAPDGGVSVEDARGLGLRIVAEAPGWIQAVAVVQNAPEELKLRLERGTAVSGRVTAVRGRQLVSGARVTVVSGGVRSTGTTNAVGEYLIADVAPGPAVLIVSHTDYAPARVEVSLARTARLDRPFELPDVDLKEAVTISGFVVDARGSPVPGARVADGIVPAYLPTGPLPPGISAVDSQGRFQLSGLEPGKHELEAYAAGVGRGRVAVEASAGRPLEDIRIALSAEPGESAPATGATVAVTLGDRASGDARIVVVVHVAEGSDAQRSGVQVGDELAAIDGAPPRSLEDARSRLSGPAGTDVLVELRREEDSVTLRLLREAVRR